MKYRGASRLATSTANHRRKERKRTPKQMYEEYQGSRLMPVGWNQYYKRDVGFLPGKQKSKYWFEVPAITKM